MAACIGQQAAFALIHPLHPLPLDPTKQVDPLPERIPPLHQAAQLVTAARRGVTPRDQLTQFARRASAMAPSLRSRALGALRKVLTAQQHQLFAPSSGGGAGGEDVVMAEAEAGSSAAAAVATAEAAGIGSSSGQCLPEVVSAAWRLAVLSADLADAELAVSVEQVVQDGAETPLLACCLL